MFKDNAGNQNFSYIKRQMYACGVKPTDQNWHFNNRFGINVEKHRVWRWIKWLHM